MSYIKGYSIAQADYNEFLTGTANGTVDHADPNLSSLLGVGHGRLGYGQTITQAAVTTNDKVSAAQWSYLLTNMGNIAAHQGTTLAQMTGTINGVAYTTPGPGVKVRAMPNVNINLTDLFAKSLNANAQTSTWSSYTNQYTASWRSAVTFTYTVTFQSGDHARYFFNSGGQLRIGFSHPSGGTGDSLKINTLFTNLCSQNNGIGQLYISAMSAGTATIKGKTFTGLTRATGTTIPAMGLPTPTTYNLNAGYYGTPITSTTVFKLAGTNLAAADRLTGYNNSYISINTYTNGPLTLNADNGNIITITARFAQSVDAGKTAIPVTGGATVGLSVIYPSTSKLANTWGTVTVTSSSTGS